MQCFTMTNIRVKGVKGGREIDLLAIDPKSGERYHVEVGINVGKKMPLQGGRQGLMSNMEKFENVHVVNKIHEIFGDEKKYNKILVVWDVQNGVVDEAEKHGVEIWYIVERLMELVGAQLGGTSKGSRDDILRTVELMAEIERIRSKPK